ncbi:MAG: outer membrane protein assembly factor BamB family protein, partial [Caulobacteraceae bacterium]
MARFARARAAWPAGLCALAAAGAVLAQAVAAKGPAAVDQRRFEQANQEPGQWMGIGRDWTEQRYSPLTQINDKNVQRLGLAWYADLNTYRGVEATPVVVDGIIYNVSAWSIVTAYDGETGKVLWTYDPKVPGQYARLACCGPVSRGVVAWHGKIILGALDGRLIGLDAKTGQVAWSVDTKDPGQPLSITGAPRIADGNVVIGNSGGDFGARGYMSAWNADTGKFAWKFYIVPGDPSKKD